MKSIPGFAFLLLAAGALGAQQVPTPILSGTGRLVFARIAPRESQTVEIPEASIKNKSVVACTPFGGSLGPEFLWSSRVTSAGIAITVGNISNTASTPNAALNWVCAIYRVD